MSPRLIPSARPSFAQSGHVLARFAQPIRRFLHVEASGGLVLVIATAMALIWANSPWHAGYESLWETAVRVEVGSYVFDEELRHVVNDLFMALFFFVVGMEVKRELVVGDLRHPRAVALPAMAALGGMVVPAAIFLAINATGEGRDGWGIPMATDIAFALGVVALLGRRVPPGVKVLLLSLAIVDDIGAIIVIAVFYSEDVDPWYLLLAAGIAALAWAMHRLVITYSPILLAVGFALWLAVFESGIHATIAGVVMGLLTPAIPRQTTLEANEIVDVLENRSTLRTAEVRFTAWAIRGSVSPCDRLIEALHPWTSYFVIPVFALANAGIELHSESFADPSAVLIGVAVGLVAGKLVGVTFFSWLAVRLGFGRLPAGARWGHIVGVAAVAGIGFTVALFITGLAYSDGDLQADAKLGTLGASAVAAALGCIAFVVTHRRVRRASTETAVSSGPATATPATDGTLSQRR